MKNKILTVCILILISSALPLVSLASGFSGSEALYSQSSEDSENPIPEYTLADLACASDELDAIPKGESTNAKRQQMLISTRAILQALGGTVDHESDEYVRAESVISRVSDELLAESLASEFVGYVSDFYSAITLEIQKSSYEAMYGIRAKLDLDYLDAGHFPLFNEAYQRSENMIVILNEKIMVENSKKLHACISYVIDFNSKEIWEAKYHDLVPFVKIANAMIDEGVFDAYYNGLDKLLVEYEPMRIYFGERILEDHIGYIKAELLKYSESTSYFEKYGISMKLRDYISENGINTTVSELPELVRINEEHIAELILESENYDAFLKENTALFIEKCQGLLGSVDYKTAKEICDEADFYFFNMDVSDARAQDALAVYDVRMKELSAMEKKAEIFINEVTAITLADRGADILALIVNAHACSVGVDPTVPGVSNAMAMLDRIMDNYDATVRDCNEELSRIREAVSYMRCFDGTEGLVTLIIKTIK